MTTAKKPADPYEAQYDAETLMRAHEIKSDKGRHGRAVAHLKKKVSAMHAVASGGKAPAKKC